MSADIIAFPPTDLRKVLLVADELDGRFSVSISPAETEQEHAFAQFFTRYDQAVAFASEVVATWGNAFTSFHDITKTGDAA